MKSTHRAVCLALLLIPLASCYTYEPITVAPRQYFESEPGRSRVTTLGGVQMLLHHPEMAEDSVASRGEGRCRFDTETSSRVCVKTWVGFDEIELVEDSTPNYWVNIPAALATAAAVGFLALWATGGYWPSS